MIALLRPFAVRAVLTLLLLLPFAALEAAENPCVLTHAPLYLERLLNDAGFRQKEELYEKTAQDFLALFEEGLHGTIADFLDIPYPYWGKWRCPARLAESGDTSTPSYEEIRDRLIVYMQQVLTHRDDPPTLLFLLEAMAGEPGERLRLPPLDEASIALFADGGFLHDGNRKQTYTFHSVMAVKEDAPGETWGVMRNHPKTAGWESRIAAILMRVRHGGKISVSAIPSRHFETFYPTWEETRDGPYPLELETLSPLEKGLGVRGCTMHRAVHIDWTQTPPAVELRLEQSYEGQEKPVPACVPECRFPYVWNGALYVPGEARCLPDGEWGAFSPFDAGGLKSVRHYAAALKEGDSRLIAHERRMTATRQSFEALFSEDTLETVTAFHDFWRLGRHLSLQPLIGQPDAFVEALLEREEPVIEHMEKVTELAKAPDARLLYALAPLMSHDRRDPALLFSDYRYSHYLNPPSKLMLHLTHEPVVETLAVLKGNAPSGDEDEDEDAVPYEWKSSLWEGLEGGDRLAFRHEEQRYHTSFQEEREYRLHRLEDGTLWGLGRYTSKGRDGGGEHESPSRHDLTLIRDGTIHFLTPALPGEEDFFRNGPAGVEEMHARKTGSENDYLDSCDMEPAFVVGGEPPFTLATDLFQTNIGSRNGAWWCTSECFIAYEWNAETLRYEREARLCRPEGEWGAIDSD